MKNYSFKTAFLLIAFALAGLGQAIAQMNAPSVKTGVTFQWAGGQPNNSSPAVLSSITINGNVFDQFVVPTGYEMTQLGPSGHNPNNIWENGSKTISGSSGAGWNSKALDAFQDKNLNHYFEANPNGRNICNNFGAISTTDAQKQSLFYNPGIPSNTGGFVAVTERGGNNCYHIAVYGEPAGGGGVQLLGQTFVNDAGQNYNGQNFGVPLGNSDYWRSGRTNDNGQTIAIAIFRLSDIAPVGATITRVQLTASTSDHGDGKFFIMQTYAVNEYEQTPINTTLNGDAGENDNVPNGSNYTVTSGPSSGTLNLNSDGTYSYTPNNGFTGTDSFAYQVCLPAPNSNICDNATVTIQVLVPPTAHNDSESGLPGNPVTLNVLSNDVPGDGNLVPATVKIAGTANAGDPLTVPGEGQWTVNPATGAITFTPQVGFTGNPTPIQYAVKDDFGMTSNLATVTITYLVGPDAVNDHASTSMNTPVTIDVLDNDNEGDAALDPTTVSLVPGTQPDAATEGVFSVDAVTGKVTFTPVSGFTGTVTGDYQVCDANGLCDIATITVDVETVSGPEANDDNATTMMNTPVNIDVLDNDVPGAAALDPTSVSLVAGTEPDAATEGEFTVDPLSGLVTFTPVSGFLGTVSINYEICDLNGLCDVATITVTVISGTTNLYPAAGPGTLAFEDLWPAKGDYDFNDLVIDYQFLITTNTSNMVEEIQATFTIKAFGASFENGFGFQLSENINADDLTVTGYNLTENFITLRPNGTEDGQTKPTIIVYDNAFNEMPHPGIGIGVNTEPSAPYVTPKTLVITIAVTPNKYNYNQLDIANFNPFIIVNKNRAVEVHLPNFPPTDLADQGMFGQWDDDSDAATGKYYLTANNLPWAINIYESFDWPIEKQDITWVHLKFAEWAVSGGVLYPNWYQNITGFRNNSLIYQVPSN